MIASVRQILRRYGLEATVFGSDGTAAGGPVRCFIQPLMYKNRVYLKDAVEKLGTVDKGHFLYIGPPETALPKEGYVVCGSRKFDILRGEPVYLGTEVCHWCAVLRPRPEEEQL